MLRRTKGCAHMLRQACVADGWLCMPGNSSMCCVPMSRGAIAVADHCLGEAPSTSKEGPWAAAPVQSV